MNYHSRKEWNKMTITLLIVLIIVGIAAYMLACHWLDKKQPPPSRVEKAAAELGPEYFKSLLKNPPKLTGKNLFKLEQTSFYKDPEKTIALTEEEVEEMNKAATILKKQFNFEKPLPEKEVEEKPQEKPQAKGKTFDPVKGWRKAEENEN